MTKHLIVILQMYDPMAKKMWLQDVHLKFISKEEFKAEIAKLKSRYPLWTGNTGHA